MTRDSAVTSRSGHYGVDLSSGSDRESAARRVRKGLSPRAAIPPVFSPLFFPQDDAPGVEPVIFPVPVEIAERRGVCGLDLKLACRAGPVVSPSPNDHAVGGLQLARRNPLADAVADALFRWPFGASENQGARTE